MPQKKQFDRSKDKKMAVQSKRIKKSSATPGVSSATDDSVFLKDLIKVDFFDQLASEVEELKTICNKASRTSILDMLRIKKIKGISVYDGTELGLQMSQIQEHVKKLRRKPNHVETRALLIDMFIRQDQHKFVVKGKDITDQILWNVMKHSLLVCTYDELNSNFFTNAMKIQQKYLEYQIREITQAIEVIDGRMHSKDSSGSSGKGVLDQLLDQKKQREAILVLLKNYKLKLRALALKNHVHINLKEFLSNPKASASTESSEQAHTPIFIFNEILKLGVYLPAIRKHLLQVTDYVNTAFPDSPVGYLHKARIDEIHAQLVDFGMIKERKAPSDKEGALAKKLRKQQVEAVSRALAAIKEGIKKVPVPKDPLDYYCIKVYGGLLLNVRELVVNVNIIPDANQCVQLLAKISDDPQAKDLQYKLNKMIEEASKDTKQ